MARTEKLEIYGVSYEGISVMEALGLSNVFLAYCDFAGGEAIQEIGFNPNTGYVYIALENNVTIASSFGQQVEYIVSDIMNGEEAFFDDYDTALEQGEAYFQQDDEE